MPKNKTEAAKVLLDAGWELEEVFDVLDIGPLRPYTPGFSLPQKQGPSPLPGQPTPRGPAEVGRSPWERFVEPQPSPLPGQPTPRGPAEVGRSPWERFVEPQPWWVNPTLKIVPTDHIDIACNSLVRNRPTSVLVQLGQAQTVYKHDGVTVPNGDV